MRSKACAFGFSVGSLALWLSALNRLETSSPCFNYYINYTKYFCLACSPIQCYIIMHFLVITPHAHARAGGYMIGAGVHIYIYIYVCGPKKYYLCVIF